MNLITDVSLWIDAGVVLVVGIVLLLLALRGTTALAKWANLSPLALRPLRFVVRWAGILVIAGLLVNRVFSVDLLSVILGGIALVAIGVVAVWSLLSHTTASLLLILLRPFRIYDWISFPGEEVGGKVVDLNLFYTLLEDDEKGENFIVPNNLFFQKTIRHVPGKGKETIELSEQFERSEPAELAAERP